MVLLVLQLLAAADWPDAQLLRIEPEPPRPPVIWKSTAALLDRDAIRLLPATHLSVPDLELEAERTSGSRWVWPGGLLLGFGVAASIAGAGLAVGSLSVAQRPVTGFGEAIGRALLYVMTITMNVVGVAAGAGGGALLRWLIPRRDEAAARNAEVTSLLEHVRAGRVTPAGEPTGLAEFRMLEDERPSPVPPIALMAIGVGMIAPGAALLTSQSQTDFIIGTLLACVGIIAAGGGTYVLIRTVQRRQEIDARMEELQTTGENSR